MLSHRITVFGIASSVAFGVVYIAGFDERIKVLIETKVAWKKFCITLWV